LVTALNIIFVVNLILIQKSKGYLRNNYFYRYFVVITSRYSGFVVNLILIQKSKGYLRNNYFHRYFVVITSRYSGCIIHDTTPDQCKAFRCIIFRIFTKEGVEIGRVTGARVLHSDDKDLRETWDEGLAKINWSGIDMEKLMVEYLSEKGYTIS